MGMCLTLLEVNRRGYTSLAGALLVSGLLLIVTITAITAGGIRSPGVSMYCVFVVMAGVLLGMRAGFITAIACCTFGLGFVLIENFGFLPASRVQYSSTTYWLLNSLYLGLVIALLRLASNASKRAWKRAQSELEERRQTERHLELALDAGAVGIWKGDLRSPRLMADKRSSEMTGIPIQDDMTFLAEDWLNCITEEDRHRVETFIASMNEGLPKDRIDYEIRRADTGARRHIEATAVAVTDAKGAVIGHVGTVHDITEQKDAQREREKLLIEIRERMKELSCLYRVLELTTGEEGSEKKFSNRFPPSSRIASCMPTQPGRGWYSAKANIGPPVGVPLSRACAARSWLMDGRKGMSKSVTE